jgi:hypothetical protein
MGEGAARTIFASDEVFAMAEPPWKNNWQGTRFANARSAMDNFTEGYHVTVAEHPRHKEWHAAIARVDPVGEEVWDFRCLDPNPGIRVFGRFSEPDVFIALCWAFREDLNGDEDWLYEIKRSVDKWKILFGELKPFVGNGYSEYVTFNSSAA